MAKLRPHFVSAVIVHILFIAIAKASHNETNQTQEYDVRNWFRVPYADPNFDISSDENDVDVYRNMLNYFDEEVELNVEEHFYELSIPDFGGKRPGRFIHDFQNNFTGIIDINGRRCFVMPLNRSQVLQPQSLAELLQKKRAGDFNIDTSVLRETMIIVNPKLTNLTTIGYHISRECNSYDVFMLERVPELHVSKRSAGNVLNVSFIEFAGNKILQFDIIRG